MSNIPQIKLRNSLIECGQSIRKENAGKYQNYTIKDCIASIAAGKIKQDELYQNKKDCWVTPYSLFLHQEKNSVCEQKTA